MLRRMGISDGVMARAMGFKDQRDFWETRRGKRTPTHRQTLALIKWAVERNLLDQVLGSLCGSEIESEQQKSYGSGFVSHSAIPSFTMALDRQIR